MSDDTPTRWVRHRFHANLEDPRPILWPPPGPYWVSGEGDDFAVVVAYLPEGADPSDLTLWPEATVVESGEPVEHPTYTSRFRKPEWWTGP